MRRYFALPLLALAITGCATVPATREAIATEAAAFDPAQAAAGAATMEQDAQRTALQTLFRESDEDNLRRNPIGALFRGDMRYADRLGDFITDEYFAGERAAATRDMARLRGINRAALNQTEQLAYDTFEFQTADTLRGLEPNILALNVVRPINHFFGVHTFYPGFASGQGAAPFRTIDDYRNNLSRHRDYVTILDRSIGRFREGMRSGIVETRMTITNVIAQLDTQIAQPLAESPYYGPATRFPDSFTDAQKAEQREALRAAVTNDIIPALTRLRNFLRDEYLPASRTSFGLSAMPGGDALYRQLIRSTTTLDMTPDEIHNLGLSEVARIRTGMEAIRAEVGFAGTLPEFFNHLRTDPRFKEASRESLTERYYAVGRQVDQQIGRFFSTLPRAALQIRPYEEYRERYEAGGSYENGTADGTRPGTFYFNAYDLPSRTTPGITTLYLHEGAPGHHFQIMLAQENEALPPFMRFGGNTAYVEGWALYAETLGYEMGLFADPYQRFGTLSDEMLRAMRLVVDTGIHAQGWSRDRAIDYMMSNSDMGRTDATAEVERYIAIPSQALAYKIGALTIQRLRRKAETELGDRFDIREFHAQVLMTGALPLPILEAKIDRWIAATRAR